MLDTDICIYLDILSPRAERLKSVIVDDGEEAHSVSHRLHPYSGTDTGQSAIDLS